MCVDGKNSLCEVCFNRVYYGKIQLHRKIEVYLWPDLPKSSTHAYNKEYIAMYYLNILANIGGRKQ